MATGGGGDSGLYSTLQKEKESHPYQRLENIVNRPTLPLITEFQRGNHGHTGINNRSNRLEPLKYVTPVESQTRYANLHSHSNESFGKNDTAASPLGPQKVDDYSGATSADDKPGREHGMHNCYKEKPGVHHHQGYCANSVYYIDYSKPHYSEAVKYTNNPGMERVDWVTNGRKPQEENDMYEEIPADERRPSSRRSVRSTSSIEPILPVAVQGKPGKRVIRLVGLVIAVLVVIAVVVAVAVALSSKEDIGGSRSDEQNKETLGTTRPSTGTTSKTSPISITGTSTTSAARTTTTLKPPLIPGHTYFTSTLVVVNHPRDKVRLQGDSVTLCCLATGTPSPVYYDWYKNDILLADQREDTNLSSSLHLTDLTTSNNGHYSCKASNTQSMVISDSAWLEVRETESFCPTNPEEYLVPLPTGCTYNGNTVYNQGYCPTAPCRGFLSPDTEHCLDHVQNCCGTISYQQHTINCGNYSYQIYTINQCGCTTCDKPLDSIVGIAQTLDGKTRFSYGHIYLRNTSTTSNDRFGTSGIFELQLENNAHRLVVLTENIYNHETFYNRTSHVIHLTNTLTGPQYLSADVRYVVKSSENRQTSQDIYKEFTLKNGSPFLSLEMENSHYYTLDNIPYNENIDISVNFISGEEVESLQAAAGDFMFIGGNGKTQHLMAYGVFVVELVGNGTPIYYTHTIDVTVMGDHFTNISQTRLWRLGNSGYWHVEDRLVMAEDGDSNNKYKAEINGLHFATTWFAIARANEWETCFTKVRIFQGNSSLAGSQLTGATVKIILTHEDGSGLVASARADTDRNDNNGYCIAHPCDKKESFNLYAMVSYEGHVLNNTSTEDSVENNMTITKASGLHHNINGATYEDSKDCSMAGITTDKFIAFRRETCETDINVVSQPLSFGTSVCHPELYQAWHSAQEQAMKLYKSCHIKILAPNLVGVTFQATSINTVESSTVESGRLYGVRQDRVISEGVVCLQIKSGGTINCNNDAENELTDVTNITISFFGNNATVSEIDATLTRNFNVGSEVGDSIFQFSFPGDSYGIYYGIFCAEDVSPESARWRSKRYCLSGKERDSEIRLNYITPNRYAVKFK